MSLDFLQQFSKVENPNERLRLVDQLIAHATDVSPTIWFQLSLVGLSDPWSRIRDKMAKAIADQVACGRLGLKYVVMALSGHLGADDWFSRDGALQVLGIVCGPTFPVAFDSQECHYILFHHLLPQCRHPQLPIRQKAAQVAARILLRLQSDEVDAIVSCLYDGITKDILDKQDCIVAGSLELALCVPALCTALADSCEDALRTAVEHPAETIRQLSAQILASGVTCTPVLRNVENLIATARRSGSEGSARAIETYCMALHSALLQVLNPKSISALRQSHTLSVSQHVMVRDAVVLIANWTSHETFEVRRVAVQALPILVQYCAAVASDRDVLDGRIALWTLSPEVLEVGSLGQYVVWFYILRCYLTETSEATTQLKRRLQAVASDVTCCRGHVRILQTVYLSEACTLESAELISLWHEGLKNDSEVAFYALDFAALYPLNALPVLPVWAATTQTESRAHVQCLLIEAMRIVVRHFCEKRDEADEICTPLFGFTAHSDFTPPALEDDGGKTCRGVFWIESVSADARASHLRRNISIPQRPSELDEALPAVCQVVNTLVPLLSTEAAVVTRLLSLGVLLASLHALQPNQLAQLCVARLQAVDSSWRRARTPSTRSITSASSHSFDDSDDDDDDTGMVQSLSTDKELVRARWLKWKLQSVGCPCSEEFKHDVTNSTL